MCWLAHPLFSLNISNWSHTNLYLLFLLPRDESLIFQGLTLVIRVVATIYCIGGHIPNEKLFKSGSRALLFRSPRWLWVSNSGNKFRSGRPFATSRTERHFRRHSSENEKNTKISPYLILFIFHAFLMNISSLDFFFDLPRPKFYFESEFLGHFQCQVKLM